MQLHLAQELQDLRLYRHIQSADRFIGHQDLRATRQGTGNGDALALTAAELARVTRHGLYWKLYLLQELFSQGFGLGGSHAKVARTFHQRLPHRHARVQRAVGVLKYHLNTVAQGTKLRFRQAGYLVLAPKNLAIAGVDQTQ